MALKRPELRIDTIHDRSVIVAPHRGARPHDIPEEITVAPHNCPFCPEAMRKQNIVKRFGRGSDTISVIKNGFPAVTQDNPKAYGYQEVIIETPAHNVELADLSVSHLDRLLGLYQQRTREISRMRKMEYILIFKNHGGKAGASLVHAHSQIFATGFVPPHIAQKLVNVRAYQIEHGSCYYCDTIAKEKRGPRRILANKHVTAIAPYVSHYPYEAWLFPTRHMDNLTRLTRAERLAFAKALRVILQKVNRTNLPYNFYLHQTLTEKDEHFYLRIAPRQQTWGGVEVGSRLVINSVAPEDAARFYRK
ncbi:MAG: galactose-1-phosphate uridylyltransferase [Patescibacteria group bacterium]